MENGTENNRRKERELHRKDLKNGDTKEIKE